jgi:hypothetical protein
MDNPYGRTFAAAVAGGTASVLGGGKFANGAVSAAFSHLFNNETEKTKSFEEVDSRIWKSINSNPGKVVDITHVELTVMMTGESGRLNLTGFYEYDALMRADGVFFGYADVRFNVVGGPLQGNYSGSDLNYYYTGFVAAADRVSMTRMNIYIRIYNSGQFDFEQIPTAKRFAEYGYKFYKNINR